MAEEIRQDQANKFETDLWIYLLRFAAGYVNGLTLLNYSQMLAGHTGNLSNTVIELAQGDVTSMISLGLMSLSFILGSTLAGYVFPYEKKSVDKRYSLVLMGMGLVLILLGISPLHPYLFLCLIAGILGLQNGMYVYKGETVIRTTILTGTLTDIGTAFGQRLRNPKREPGRTRFHIVNLLAFLAGVFTVSLISYYTGINTTSLAGLIYILIGWYLG